MKEKLTGSVMNPEKIYGKSAYEIAVMHGFKGTEEEWLDSLVNDVEKRAAQAVSDANASMKKMKETAAAAQNDIENSERSAVEHIEQIAEEYSDIVQEMGDSETAVMSQNATSYEIMTREIAVKPRAVFDAFIDYENNNYVLRTGENKYKSFYFDINKSTNYVARLNGNRCRYIYTTKEPSEIEGFIDTAAYFVEGNILLNNEREFTVHSDTYEHIIIYAYSGDEESAEDVSVMLFEKNTIGSLCELVAEAERCDCVFERKTVDIYGSLKNSNDRIVTKLDSNCYEIRCFEGIEALVYAFNKDFYVGRIIEDGTFSQEGTALYQTSIDLTKYPSFYCYIIQFRNTDLSVIDVSSAQNIIISKKINNQQTHTKYSPLIGSPRIYIPEIMTNEYLDDKTSDEVYAIYEDLCANHPHWISRESDIGVDSDENPIRHYVVRMQKPVTNAESYPNVNKNEWKDEYDYTNIVINAGTHGDEKSSVFGVASFVEELIESNDEWALFVKSNFIIHIIPLLNVWGFNNFSRNNKNGININRDMQTLETVEAQALTSFCLGLGDKLKVILDSHNTMSNIGFIGAPCEVNRFHDYLQVGAQLGGALYGMFTELYNDASLFPYYYMWKSTSGTGSMNYWINQHGYIGTVVEAPRSVGSSGSQNNRGASRTITKAILGNLIQSFGHLSKFEDR